MARLGDLVTISSSSEKLKSDTFWLLNLDMVEQQTGNILEYNYVSKDQLNGSIIQFDTDVVLYSKLRPNLNKVVLPKRAGFATSEILPLRPDSSKLLREYLAVYLRSDNFVTWAVSKTAGAKMPRLGTKELLSKDIPLPSLSEQKHIATKFSKIDHLIWIRKQQLSKLDELVKSRFIEMFGDPEANPNRWSISKLSEFCDLQNGYAFKSDDYLTNSTVLNCRMSNIRPDGGFDADYHPKYLPDMFWEKYKDYRLVDGDVIIAMTDMASDPKILGVPTIVRTNGKKFLLNQRVGKLTFFDNTAINNVYLMFVLSQKHIRQQLVKSAGGSTQINVGKPAVLGVEFFVPPMKLQEQFAAFVKQTDKSKLAIQKSLEKLEILKKSLMQKYFG